MPTNKEKKWNINWKNKNKNFTDSNSKSNTCINNTDKKENDNHNDDTIMNESKSHKNSIADHYRDNSRNIKGIDEN